MLKFTILIAILLWIHNFFVRPDFPGEHYSSRLTYILSIAIIGLIIIGFLS
jgi:hypothetical protein